MVDLTHNKTSEMLNEISDTMKVLRNQFPDIMKGFDQSFMRIDKEGVLETKTKRLISLAIALVKKCEFCVIYYVKKALEARASVEEILEASMSALKMDGGPGLMHITWVIRTLRDLQKLE
ncbi:MAG: carboxymuconolactone decarboxylase family protein [Promethearchaeota archaeon]|nr:MAG: carboxymuconolactone decarboxylase family protein [Candidatus Lokiarchaeota archaeon]